MGTAKNVAPVLILRGIADTGLSASGGSSVNRGIKRTPLRGRAIKHPVEMDPPFFSFIDMEGTANL
jgi:hypothetical protein